ncbi:MAG: DNA-binding protein, partial [Ruminococcaceae bacterium]|nr:DNA-binding protein [Oscillospiraceae bacterium]
MQKLIDAFNSLNIAGMPELKKLYGHKGDFVNLECELPN